MKLFSVGNPALQKRDFLLGFPCPAEHQCLTPASRRLPRAPWALSETSNPPAESPAPPVLCCGSCQVLNVAVVVVMTTPYFGFNHRKPAEVQSTCSSLAGSAEQPDVYREDDVFLLFGKKTVFSQGGFPESCSAAGMPRLTNATVTQPSKADSQSPSAGRGPSVNQRQMGSSLPGSCR